jgi:hypothetical protein
MKLLLSMDVELNPIGELAAVSAGSPNLSRPA